ncbi:MAG: polysulfide reductase NrfD [Bdellovibrio sp.]|nr:polysulfide reductase NrfD [Bdellovibrio sp.]
MFQTALTGSKRYYIWLGFLLAICLMGLRSYFYQLNHGLIVTNLSDNVSWGAYIANFTYLVGVAAAAVILVTAAYVYHNKAIHDIVLLGELMAFSALVMCLLFITVDLGRPDRFWHIIPFLGRFNFPNSILAWDVIVLNGYLLLNMYIPGYLLYNMYSKQKAVPKFYMPFVFISIFWAVSIHTVTAFLYSGLGGRPFWNSAILAPRFLVSAFACGPALLILTFTAINHFYKDFKVKEEVFKILKSVLFYTLPLNMFLLFCELFKEFYTDSLHVASAQYLFFGLHGHHMLVPYIWTAICFNTLAMIVFMTKLREKNVLVYVACGLAILGTWTEKGMGLIIPAFIPSVFGDIVEYSPSLHEFWICMAIWSFGVLTYTINSRVCIAILNGNLCIKRKSSNDVHCTNTCEQHQS